MPSKKSVEKESIKFMKMLRPALIAAILCFFAAGAALAQSHIHVVFDPPPPVFLDPNTVFTPVNPGAGSVTFAWGSCADDPFAPEGISNDTACANFANGSKTDSISALTATFIADSAIANSVDCVSIDPALSNAFCPDGTTEDGQPVNISFTGGLAIPPSGNPKGFLSVFFLAETGVSADDINKLQWTVAAPEPSSITLLAAGMGLIGLCMVLAKR